MKKIVVIGANSYIARNCIYFMSKQNRDVHMELYDHANEHADHAENYHQIDILSQESVSKIDLDCDAIYMFVGKTGSANGFDIYDQFIDINQRALLNVLNEYRKQKSKAKIIFPSTRLVYKGSSSVLSEESKKKFRTVYAINKYACEKYIEQYHNVFDVDYCIFRICIPYGSLIPNVSSYGTAEFMLNKARNRENIVLYGDGSVRRTLTYMGDLCWVLTEAAFNDKCVNNTYNIGGEDYSLAEMADLIAKRYHVKVKNIEYPEIALKIESGSTVFDDTKLQKVIQYDYAMRFEKWSQLC